MKKLSCNCSTLNLFPIILVALPLLVVACKKGDKKETGFDTPNSLTLFKGTDSDLTISDTVRSQSNTSGKFIPISGTVGAARGLKTINLDLYLQEKDSIIASKSISTFFRPDYTVLNNVALPIPTSFKGKLYRINVSVTDNDDVVIENKDFLGIDLITCDPLPPCIASNQITVLIQTPADTPPEETLSIFGGFNGWARADGNYNLNKNPDVANCYCISLDFPPGAAPWQLGELYVTRGTYATDGVQSDGSVFVSNYANTDLGNIWRITVPKWRDK